VKVVQRQKVKAAELQSQDAAEIRQKAQAPKIKKVQNRLLNLKDLKGCSY
jgi:hypothetical protein